jgi:hypothetical protein
MIDYAKKAKEDDLLTPMYAVTPLIPYLPRLREDGKPITYWEPAALNGRSGIVNYLLSKSYKIHITGLPTFDFLKDGIPADDFDVIITNPPFSLKNDFIRQCFSYNKPFALLLPLTALEGVERGKMWREYGVDVMVLDQRVEFTGKGGVWFNVSWFTHGLLPERLIFAPLNKPKKVKW